MLKYYNSIGIIKQHRGLDYSSLEKESLILEGLDYNSPEKEPPILKYYNSIGILIATNNQALRSKYQCFYSNKAMENEQVYLVYKYQRRYNIQIARNYLNPFRSSISMTLMTSKQLFVRGLDSYKHLMPRKQLLAILLGTTTYILRQKTILDVIYYLQT